MNIENYTSYFHDGSIIAIKQNNEKIEILMESSEILPEWKINSISLSQKGTIRGKLILHGIKKIIVNDVLVETLQQNYDDGEILRFRINENMIDLIIEWYNFPPKEHISKFEHFTIQASQIEWENIPDFLLN